MLENLWYKVAKLIVRMSGNPLVQANENLVELLQFLLNEEQVTFLLNFKKPILTFQELKERTDISDTNLIYILNSLMDNGIIVDIPNKVTGVMEYRLQAPIPDIFEYSLVKNRSWEDK
jgi:hypothetical protein